jgi:hypothetical protein
MRTFNRRKSMEIMSIVIISAMALAGGVVGAGGVLLGWWMAVLTMKTEYVPIPFSETRAMKKAKKERGAQVTKAITESYDDVLNDAGE